jgi:hypothetical protein
MAVRDTITEGGLPQSRRDCSDEMPLQEKMDRWLPDGEPAETPAPAMPDISFITDQSESSSEDQNVLPGIQTYMDMTIDSIILQIPSGRSPGNNP